MSSSLFLWAMLGVVAMLVVAIYEAVTSVARTPTWQAPRMPQRVTQISVVPQEERRGQALPFVGRDRRVRAVARVRRSA